MGALYPFLVLQCTHPCHVDVGRCNDARPLILVTGALIVLLLAIPASALHVLSPADDSPLLGPSFPISSAPGVQDTPVVVYNATSDEYLVVWQDARNGVTDYSIYGQRVSASGTLLGDNFAIAATDGNQLHPAAAWNAESNEYLVVWEDLATSTPSALPQMVTCWGVDSPFLLLLILSRPLR